MKKIWKWVLSNVKGRAVSREGRGEVEVKGRGEAVEKKGEVRRAESELDR